MILALILAAACDPQALPKPAERIHCHYSQEKQAKLFKKKVTSKGELWVRGGDLRFDMFVVAGGVAKLKSGERVETLPIDKLPKVSAFLGAFSGLFVGKLSGLEKDFTLACPAPDAIVLTPKTEAFAFLSSIRLGLANKELKTLELTEKNGDTSTIRLERCDDVVPATAFEL